MPEPIKLNDLKLIEETEGKLVLRCQYSPGFDSVIIEPEQSRPRPGHGLAISTKCDKRKGEVFIDEAQARALFAYLGAWLHTYK